MNPSRLQLGRRSARGLSIIELMVGMAVGLVATVVVAQVLVFSEGQKRSTTSGSDAQISGALALYSLQRDLEMAGYGVSSSPNALGCAISASYNGAAPVGFPATLAPVVITQGAAGAPDTISVLSSSKVSYSVPTRVIAPGYDPTDPTPGGKAFRFPVVSTLGIKQGDLLVAVTDAVTPCSAFQATADAAAGFVPRDDVTNGWNATGQPSTAYGDGSFLLNMGAVVFRTYAVNASNVLQVTNLNTPTNSTATTDLQANIVNVQAMYGKDTNLDDVIDLYDTVTPTTNVGWTQVKAIRIAVVARSSQFEQEAVTSANPLWDVGNATTVAGTTTCGASKCLSLKVDGLADWARYRYRVFDTVIPLRNMVWRS